MSNTGVFALPHGVVFAPHLGGAEKKNFRYANLHPLPLSYTPHFPNPRNIPVTSTIPSVHCHIKGTIRSVRLPALSTARLCDKHRLSWRIIGR